MDFHDSLLHKGYCIIPSVYSPSEVGEIDDVINAAGQESPLFRKSKDLFAIRQFLKQVPEAAPAIFTSRLADITTRLFGNGYFVVKSIYFDKPAASNWFVAYHQDLTISVGEKVNIDGYGPWTVKQDQFAVQPPMPVLEDNFTIRIHLDDAGPENGALKVVPGSHRKGEYRAEAIDWSVETEDTCEVPAGGVMIMRPLLLHASGRTTNQQRRRVLHIEFSRTSLPSLLHWSEKLEIF
ncbi:MAG: phytanoyl-CoA dioxygenase [Chitinophagaceae bacterium]|nr:MAG: phytanoyl-CoA dioxygenase [Chitinophagaceae bacterium]